jgi:glycosyltransferase involved in cell wall biosynthesis
VGSESQRELKGYDDCLVPLQERLTSMGIASDFRLVDSFGSAKRSQQVMAAWYNTGTILVCASQAEGTPNPGLEAAACGCVLVSTPVGNMTELVRSGQNGYLVERSVDSLLAGVLAAIDGYPRLAAQLQRDIQHWGWHTRSHAHFDAFRRVLDSPPASGVRATTPRT